MLITTGSFMLIAILSPPSSFEILTRSAWSTCRLYYPTPACHGVPCDSLGALRSPVSPATIETSNSLPPASPSPPSLLPLSAFPLFYATLGFSACRFNISCLFFSLGYFPSPTLTHCSDPHSAHFTRNSQHSML